jgi:hypothetical protein
MTMPMATGPPSHVAVPDAVAAIAATVVAIVLLNMAGLERTTAVMRRLRTGGRMRPATIDEASGACAAIDSCARWLPFRVACLERSVSAYLLLGIRGRRVGWHLGVRIAPPLVIHAWITADGQPIGQIEDIATAYRPLLTL